MREPDRDPGRLADIIKAADYVGTFVANCSFESFFADKMRYFAVLKNIEIIGEAAYMLTSDFKDTHPEIPWEQIVKMRHILVHGYSAILPEILWETAINDVPHLLTSIKALSK